MLHTEFWKPQEERFDLAGAFAIWGSSFLGDVLRGAMWPWGPKKNVVHSLSQPGP